jgi:hypothetical protein
MLQEATPMDRRGLSRRRFTLRDPTILIAATAVGLWLGRTYLLNEPDVFGPGVSLTWWIWVAVVWAVLMPVQLGLLAVSLLTPRPRLRRLARQPGFVAGVAVAVAFASNVLYATSNFKASIARGSNPIPTRIHNNIIAISAPYRLAPFVLLAWTMVRLQGPCRRSHDWVERSARFLGGVWVIAWFVHMVIRVFE